MKTIILLIGIFSLTGCAGLKLSDCPTADIEPVSVCRAQAMCHKGSFGHIFGTMLSGMGAGMSKNSRNMADDSYNICVRQQIMAQKTAIGIPDNPLRCTSRRVASDEVETVCD